MVWRAQGLWPDVDLGDAAMAAIRDLSGAQGPPPGRRDGGAQRWKSMVSVLDPTSTCHLRTRSFASALVSASAVRSAGHRYGPGTRTAQCTAPLAGVGPLWVGAA